MTGSPISMLMQAAAVAGGAACGALLRWMLSGLNALCPTLPFGTLLANALGGFLVGVALVWLPTLGTHQETLRLLLVTGFLGGLTTFSTFSAEVVVQWQRQAYGAALGLMVAHLGLSLSLTGIGMMVGSWRWR